MTPRPFDADTVQAKLRLMDELLGDLTEIGAVTAERLVSDRLTRHALERILTQLVELASAVNAHLSAAFLGKAPADFRQSFALAAEVGAISPELAASLAPSAGFRNLLVHEYGSIDLEQVARTVPVAAAGFRAYVRAVAGFLAREA
jgi:uncharacterized protein YutE (UPF0331/DUF86 family)